MKKIITILTSLTALTCSMSFAQTFADAWTYSKQDYEGTARSMAMGNAFTAVGGDMGGIGINPAGSAVYKHSDFTFTFGGEFANSRATGINGIGFSNATRSGDSHFGVPNLGTVIYIDAYRDRGIKSHSVGFVYNRTQSYNSSMAAGGLNSQTSWASALAQNTNGISSGLIEKDPFYNGVPWSSVLGWYTGAISNLQGGSDDFYAGITDNVYSDGTVKLGGELDQRAKRVTYGNKSDMLINYGMNISDIIFLGVNLGFVSIDYMSDTYFNEYAVNSSDFQEGFVSLNHRSALMTSGTGVYGKIGIIATPFAGLRIGAAIQTPTSTTITERWFEDLTVNTTKYGTSSEGTPEGNYKYRVISPFRYNLGIAYTFGPYGLISFDYESVDYRSMRMIDIYGYDTFDGANMDISKYMGQSHYFRAGIEINPLPCLSLRGGYNLITPSSDLLEHGNTNIYSVGIGYKTKGSFYTDLTFRHAKSSGYFTPYSYYNNPELNSLIKADYSLTSVVLTLGFRF